MPMIDGIEYAPDEAVAIGLCPECGKDLRHTTAALEIGTHWPRGITEEVCSPEGIRRAGLIAMFFRPKESI